MSKVERYRITGLFFLGLVLLTRGVFAQEIEIAELEKIYGGEVLVFSSAKREQPISEAASSIAVITADEIIASGAVGIADVLRQVSGIEVRELRAGDHFVGIRGFPDSQHVLVTLDGSNIFIYHANVIFWDAVPIGLEEIERIEIIKGPGAIFYGGNAFSGVINIVTKTPNQINGTETKITMGEYDTKTGNFLHGGSHENWDYSISVGHREAKRWQPGIDDRDANTDYYGLKTIYHIDEETAISLSGRYGDTDRVVGGICDPENTYLSAHYETADLWARFFYNSHCKDCYLSSQTINYDDNNYEFEVLKIVRWDNNITTFGGYLKHVYLTTINNDTNVKEKCDLKDFAVNAENEYRFNDQLMFTLGGRLEYVSELDFIGLGRGSIIYGLSSDQTMRFTIANGYYIPSLLQFYSEGAIMPGAISLGNISLTKEKITTYELAYDTYLFQRVKLNATLFYNDYQDIIKPAGLSYANAASAYQQGAELGVDILLIHWLTGFVSYTYQNIHREDYDDLDVSPAHMLNFGFNARFDRWSANMGIHYADKFYDVGSSIFPVTVPVRIDAYTTVDTRVAYLFKDNLEFAIAVYNLFEERHREGANLGLVSADEIGRRVTVSASYKF
ncbi:MAG: TonB-dependent receptor [Candidatus Omnitrophota bacterium]